MKFIHYSITAIGVCFIVAWLETDFLLSKALHVNYNTYYTGTYCAYTVGNEAPFITLLPQ